jgi:hypothetical protein
MREATGKVTMLHDRHVEGLFSVDRWLQWFRDAGIPAVSTLDPWNRHVFIARPAGVTPR